MLSWEVGKAIVSQIGGGALGPLVSDAWDCNVYLVEGSKRAAVVDAGAGRIPLKPPPAATILLLTHLHVDHSGGAAALAAGGMRVLAHRWTAEGLARGDEERSGLAISRRRGFYPADFTLPPCAQVEAMTDGDAIDLGGCRLTAVDTAGHSDGHHSYLLESEGRRAIFSGDLVFEGGRVALQALPDCRLDRLWESVERIRGLGPTGLYAGHGRPVLEGATDHLEAALTAFRQGGVPSQLA